MTTFMDTFLLVLLLLLQLSFSMSGSLSEGSSFSVVNPNDVLVSPDGVFTAGFYPVGTNAFCFSIWFTEPPHFQNLTVVWMANRDQPVNGKKSQLSLKKNGNLVLTDAGKFIAWETSTVSFSSVRLELNNIGSLVLRTSDGSILWQSFDSPTNTLLPLQPLTQYAPLVSSRSLSNHSSGFYSLIFDNDNLLKLLFDTRDISSVFWPDPWLISWEAGRSTYNNSRIAMLNSLGNFSSSDDFTFLSADYGARNVQRRLTMDIDGNLRLYSRENPGEKWVISWQAIQEPCKIHGICGANSFCRYVPSFGRRCLCLPGYKPKDPSDWSSGCEPDQFNISCDKGTESSFIRLPHAEFYGYDFGFYPKYTYKNCENLCLELCCVGFQYKYSIDDGYYNCYPKTMMLNGYQSPAFSGDLYVRLPKDKLLPYNPQPVEVMRPSNCSGEVVELKRTYFKKNEKGTVKFMLWFACGVGGIEILCILLVWCCLARSHKIADRRDYYLAETRFRRFTYSELKKATRDFSEEIGSGAGGVVYKGTLPDQRIAAIKRLREANPGEAEFLAEVSTIGMLNHMNLIEMWGYCAEGKHRLLIYEYMEHGSLAKNLSSKTLDWEKRFQIAVGTAKGLAYLHEECLEWVLHCDIKPQNILLNSNYEPKVADFGLSKLLNRGEINNSSFLRVRGTRGYMAPEWVGNFSITSKVDVYSYGIVLLELVTGKSPLGGDDNEGETINRRLVAWVRKKTKGGHATSSCMEEIVDDVMNGEYDMVKMDILVNVALKCVEEDRNARPTMSQVVEMLLNYETDDK